MDLVHRLVGDHDFLILTAKEVEVGDLLLIASYAVREVLWEHQAHFLGYRVLSVGKPGDRSAHYHHQLLDDGVSKFGVLRPKWPLCPQCEQRFAPGTMSDPHARSDGQPCLSLVLYRTYFLESDVHDGDVPHDDVRVEVTDLTPDEWDAADGLTCADLAVKHLLDEGLTSASSSNPRRGDWFSNPDGSRIVDHATGRREETTGHLHGLTDEQVAEVFTKLRTAVPR